MRNSVLIVIAFTLLLSCKKTDTAPGCKIQKITLSYATENPYNMGDIYLEYKYRGDFVEKVTYFHFYDSTLIKSYTQDSIIFKNGFPVECYHLEQPGTFIHKVFKFESSRLSQIITTYYTSGIVSYFITSDYTYNENGVLKESISRNFNSGKCQIAHSSYTFDQNRNLIEIESTSRDSSLFGISSDSTVYLSKYEFSDYDNKQNIFQNMFWNDDFIIYSFSKNNFGNCMITDQIGNLNPVTRNYKFPDNIITDCK